MVIDAKHLAKRCHREGEFLQPNNFSLLLSIYLDRLTLKLLCILFLSSFFTFTIKEETMTNFFRTTCQRLYDNYTFTYRIFSSSDKLIAQLYTQALNNLESLAKKSLITGFSHAEVEFYTRMFKRKLSTHYYSRVKLPA